MCQFVWQCPQCFICSLKCHTSSVKCASSPSAVSTMLVHVHCAQCAIHCACQQHVHHTVCFSSAAASNALHIAPWPGFVQIRDSSCLLNVNSPCGTFVYAGSAHFMNHRPFRKSHLSQESKIGCAGYSVCFPVLRPLTCC